MLPFVVIGAFIVWFAWLDKVCEPEQWKNRKEQQSFHKEREQWIDQTVFWNIRR